MGDQLPFMFLTIPDELVVERSALGSSERGRKLCHCGASSSKVGSTRARPAAKRGGQNSPERALRADGRIRTEVGKNAEEVSASEAYVIGLARGAPCLRAAVANPVNFE